VAVADSELPALRRRVELRKLTNLRNQYSETTRRHIGASRALQASTSRPIAGKSFHTTWPTSAPWRNARRWDDAQADHGFNGTPVWNIAGSLLANLAPCQQDPDLTS